MIRLSHDYNVPLNLKLAENSDGSLIVLASSFIPKGAKLETLSGCVTEQESSHNKEQLVFEVNQLINVCFFNILFIEKLYNISLSTVITKPRPGSRWKLIPDGLNYRA
jgi:hypothetical protein